MPPAASATEPLFSACGATGCVGTLRAPPPIRSRSRLSQIALRLGAGLVCNASMSPRLQTMRALTPIPGRFAAALVAFIALPFSICLGSVLTAHVRSYPLCCRGARRGPSVFYRGQAAIENSRARSARPTSVRALLRDSAGCSHAFPFEPSSLFSTNRSLCPL